jgi:hypothetical protein
MIKSIIVITLLFTALEANDTLHISKNMFVVTTHDTIIMMYDTVYTSKKSFIFLKKRR